MKKLLPLLVLMMLVCNTMYAQKKTITAGIKGGINLSSLRLNQSVDYLKYSTKVGLQAGVFARLPLCGNFSLQSELLWNSLGAKYNSDMDLDIPVDTTIHTDGTQALQYISLPVLVRYRLSHSGFHLYAGPQASYLVSANLKQTGSAKASTLDLYKRFDLSAVAGLEYEIPHTHFSIIARYQFGITDISKGSYYKPKHNAGSLAIAYHF